MRIAVINQRLSLIRGEGAVDVHAASRGRFGPDAASAYERWAEFTPLIEQLSLVTPLLPGDIIFTGTPSGVGLGRSPQRWLAPGDVLTSYIEGIGEMSQRFVAAADAPE